MVRQSTSRILVLAILALWLVSGLEADEKPITSPVADAKTDKQQGPTVKPPDPEKEIVNSIGMKLCLIRAGNYLMGSPDSEPTAAGNEKPQHRVQITKAFCLGKYEVTRGEFRKFVVETNYRTDVEEDRKGGHGYVNRNGGELALSPKFTWKDTGFEQDDQHPVVNVSWHDASAFCKWLSKRDGHTYRLPTEAEWEWACRAGTIERWNCGDREEDLKGNANIADASLKLKMPQANWTKSFDDGFPFTAPVGQFRANKLGLHDMHGNVWEWCADWYDENYYAKSSTKDPAGPGSGTHRVARGGSWDYFVLLSRSARRIDLPPRERGSHIGFRVARDDLDKPRKSR